MSFTVIVKGQLSRTVSLEVGDEKTIGPCVGIYLTEDPKSTTRWEILVSAKTMEGDFCVGRVLTIGPASNPLVRESASRLVAIANAPGAMGWSVTLRAFNADGVTPVTTKTGCTPVLGKSPPGQGYDETIFPGVYPVNTNGTGRQVARIVTAQVNAGAGAQVWATEQPFRVKARIRNDGAAGGAAVFIGDPATLTAANGYQLQAGQEYIDESNRALAVITAGGNVVCSTLIEE